MFKQDYKRNTWQSVCVTWDGRTGLVQLWLDGRPSARKYCTDGNLNSNSLIMIGQVVLSINTYCTIYQYMWWYIHVCSSIYLWRCIKCLFVNLSPQEQDSHGGGFDLEQSFVGMMTDVHMWNLVLSPCEIQRYVEDLPFYSPGNVINWKALNYQIFGKIFVNDKNGLCLVKRKTPIILNQSCQGWWISAERVVNQCQMYFQWHCNDMNKRFDDSLLLL